ncbi:AsmA-like C-terminal region-containing protein [Winogradskyella ursingii]|uniref:AsmA-like C-terminal region-containing protein n=1 Tax=Winogradskyella ursingii TaxID=2686079 RepID=UPI0015C75B3E|nr:AsmA-like C-terminal region-containing protein [Winogradskyella ursingii]
MQTPKSHKKRYTYLKWRKKILSVLLLIVLFPTILFTIGWFNRDTVIDYMQDWYNENNSGTLKIGSVNASFISDFPKIGFTLKDIKQTHQDSIADQFSSIEIEKAKLTIGAGNLLRGDIKFEKIIIENAIISSEVISERPLEYHEKLKQNEKNKPGLNLPEWLHPDGVSFTLKEVKYLTKDTILNKQFNVEIHSIQGSYKRDQNRHNGNLAMDITVNTMGFNTNKGSYFNGARVTGNPNFVLDLENDHISVPEFLFNVDNQPFVLSANFDLSESDSYEFILQNSNTDFETLKTLLPRNISSKIELYNLELPINTNLNLFGEFAYGNDANIKVDFYTENNNIIIGKNTSLKNVSFSGQLTNNIYTTDSLKRIKKTASDLKITFNDLVADIEDIKVEIENAYYQSTPDALNYVNADILLKGSNEALAQLIETENFDFIGGSFQLNANISGNIPNPYQFIDKAKGNFILNNTQVILKKNGLQLPILVIDLDLNRGTSTLNQLVINLPNDENMALQGQLENISGLIAKNPVSTTTSHISLNAKQLNINNIIELAKEFIPESTATIDDRKTLHETLQAIYGQFHPSFDIDVEALTYNDVTISDLKSNIDLINAETILLRNFDFNYLEASTNIKGNVIVPKPESNLSNTININAEATSNGSISIFRDLFNIQLFRIDAGKYEFNGTVNGNVKQLSELLNNAKGDLILSKTKLYYPPADMDIAIDSLKLFVDESDMFLRKFDVEIGDLSPINLSGNIKKFPTFLLDEIPEDGSIYLKIAASYMDGDALLTEINSFKNEDISNNKSNNTALSQLFKDINRFNPKIELAIDSLKYQDLNTENINALAFFENDSILKLDYLNFNYQDTSAKISGEVNAHTDYLEITNNNPFDLDFSVSIKGKSKDLNAYLKTKNFIFQSGDFEFKGEYKAQAKDLQIINSNGFGDLKIGHSIIDYNVAGLEIPIDSLHVEINDDVATLKTLDINLPGKSSVYFAGSINQFSDFINNVGSDTLRSSNFTIYSPYLDSADILKFLANSSYDKVETTKKEFSLEQFKGAMIGINSSFYPTANISVDTLSHNNLNITDFGLNLLFDKNSNFKIKDTHLNFYGGTIDLNVDVGIASETSTPVKIRMKIDSMDLNTLVTKFDYFDDQALRNTDKIGGNLSFSMSTKGIVDREGQLDLTSLNGQAELNLTDLMIYNYKPIMDNSVLMKDERFKNLKFRPIVQTFNIVNGELIIPRTEIQSSALHVFAEGRLKFDEYVNIWLSLPWKNLKRNKGLTLPKKTTYADAGSKFYVQLIQDKTEEKKKNRDLKVKFRLSNRKLRKMNAERN